MNKAAPELVMLVHGIWMSGLDLLPLARRLRHRGFRTHIFRHASLRRSPRTSAALLQKELLALDAPVIHFVGHSLGGILLLHLFDQFPEQKPGRVLMLGSPIQGSQVAARIARYRAGRRLLLGRSCEQGLLGETPTWSCPRPLAMIAGTHSLGLGKLIAPDLDQPNDGTVALTETMSPVLDAHLSVPSSHLGLLLSGSVADSICRFLKSGELR